MDKNAAHAADVRIGDVISYTQEDRRGEKKVFTNVSIDPKTMSPDFINFIINLKVGESKRYHLGGFTKISYKITLIEKMKRKKWYTTILEKLHLTTLGKALKS